MEYIPHSLFCSSYSFCSFHLTCSCDLRCISFSFFLSLFRPQLQLVHGVPRRAVAKRTGQLRVPAVRCWQAASGRPAYTTIIVRRLYAWSLHGNTIGMNPALEIGAHTYSEAKEMYCPSRNIPPVLASQACIHESNLEHPGGRLCRDQTDALCVTSLAHCQRLCDHIPDDGCHGIEFAPRFNRCFLNTQMCGEPGVLDQLVKPCAGDPEDWA